MEEYAHQCLLLEEAKGDGAAIFHLHIDPAGEWIFERHDVRGAPRDDMAVRLASAAFSADALEAKIRGWISVVAPRVEWCGHCQPNYADLVARLDCTGEGGGENALYAITALSTDPLRVSPVEMPTTQEAAPRAAEMKPDNGGAARRYPSRGINAFFVCSLWLLACALLLIKMLGLVPWERGEWWDELLGHLILGAILALFVLPPPRRRKGINA